MSDFLDLNRYRFSFDDVAREIVYSFPEKYFVSTTATFCDPAMAGGQLLKWVIYRLREHKHLDGNISGRVFGFNPGMMRVKFAIKTSKLIGQFEDLTFEDFKEDAMDFDVMLSNPPYKASGQKAKTQNASKLWIEFIKLGIKKAEYIGFIVPNSWMNDLSPTAAKVRDLIHNKGLDYIEEDVSEHFNVGEDIGCFVAGGDTSGWDGDVFGEEAKKTKAIIDKVVSSLHPRVEHKRFSAKKKENWPLVKDEINKYPVMWTASSYADEGPRYSPNDFGLGDQPRLMINISGYYYKPGTDKYMFPSTELVPGLGACAIMFDTMEEVQNAFTAHSSKLFRFIAEGVRGFGGGGFTRTAIKLMPQLDMSHPWTDSEIYKELDLTEEEIKFVELKIVD